MADISTLTEQPPYERNIFTNRTLNMRSIQAIGYDMDYTLIDYDAKLWEQTAYDHLKNKLLNLGWPVDDLEFDPENPMKGLIGLHPGGFQVVFGDGSVRFITETIDRAILEAIITRSGGEPVGAF